MPELLVLERASVLGPHGRGLSHTRAAFPAPSAPDPARGSSRMPSRRGASTKESGCALRFVRFAGRVAAGRVVGYFAGESFEHKDLIAGRVLGASPSQDSEPQERRAVLV